MSSVQCPVFSDQFSVLTRFGKLLLTTSLQGVYTTPFLLLLYGVALLQQARL